MVNNKLSAFHWRDHPMYCDWSSHRKSAASSKAAAESNERRRQAGENTSIPVGKYKPKYEVVMADRFGGAYSRAEVA
jgi:hypothetical protein